MEIALLTVVAAAFVIFSLVSRRLSRLAITPPMVFVTLGLLVHAGFDVSGLWSREAIHLLMECALAIVLFIDASRVGFRWLRKDERLPGRMLGLGFPSAMRTTLGEPRGYTGRHSARQASRLRGMMRRSASLAATRDDKTLGKPRGYAGYHRGWDALSR